MSRWRYLFCLLMATYYVSDSLGSDANSGLLQAAPAKTLSWVSSHAKSPDDQFKLMRTDQFVGTLTCTSSGSAGHPIIFGAWGSGAKPIIAPGKERGGYAQNCEYVYFEDIRVEGVGVVAATGKMADNSTDWRWGFDFENSLTTTTLHNVKALRCEVVGCFGGILLHSESSTLSGYDGFEFSDFLGHDLISLGIWTPGPVGYATTGLPFKIAKGRIAHHNGLINSPTIYNVYGMPISEYSTIPGDYTTYTYHNYTGSGIVVQNTTTAIITNGLIHTCGHLNNDGRGGPVLIMTLEADAILIDMCEGYDSRTSLADGTGIDMDGGTINSTVSRSWIHGCVGSPFASGTFDNSSATDSNIFEFNICQGNGGTSAIHTFGSFGTNLKIRRNTFDHVPSGDYAVLNGYGAGWLYQNNIAITTGAGKVLAHCTNTGGGIDGFEGNWYWSQSGHIRFTDDTHTNSGTPFSSIAGFRTSTNLVVPPETRGGVDCGSYGDPALLNVGGGGTIGNTALMNSLLTAYDPASGGAVNTVGVTGGTTANDFHGNAPISGTAVGAVEYHAAGFPVFYVQRAAH